MYDQETGFYYLTSRYYDPAVGRFLNADDTDFLGAEGELTGYNLFSYCSNNPVMGYDPQGSASFWETLKCVGLEVAKQAAVVAGIATAAALIIGGISGTIVSGGAAAVALPAAFTLAVSVAEASIAIATVSAGVAAVGTIGESITYEHGRGNQRDSGLRDVSDEELERRIKDPKTSSKDKARYVKEQKARGLRNKSKRSGYSRSK